VWVVLGVIGIAIVLSALFSGGKSSDIAYNEFIQKVQAGQVQRQDDRRQAVHHHRARQRATRG